MISVPSFADELAKIAAKVDPDRAPLKGLAVGPDPLADYPEEVRWRSQRVKHTNPWEKLQPEGRRGTPTWSKASGPTLKRSVKAGPSRRLLRILGKLK